MKGKIYCIENDINNKKYVGKTTYPSIQQRFVEHCIDSRKPRMNKRPLYDAMQKYGIEHFTIVLLEEPEIDCLSEREQYWIEYYNTYSSGYNATRGGDGKCLYDYDIFCQDFRDGMLVGEIADKYGCDIGTVSKALRGENIDTHLNANNSMKNKVAQYDREGNFIAVFDSQRAAASHLIGQGHTGSISSIATNIGRVLCGSRHSAKGYVWKIIL